MRSLAAAAIALGVSAVAFSAQAQSQGTRPPADGAVAGRIERLEEQLVDLQGVVAAVETLAKQNSGGATGYSAANGGASAEQIRQLSEQLADLTQRLERLEARLGANTVPAGSQPRQQAAAPQLPGGFENKEPLPPIVGAPPQEGRPEEPRRTANVGQQPLSAAQPSTRPQGASTGAARSLFDQAYGALNKREYSAAETYFQQFLEQYPSDPLAGSAQYWLGETAFVSGEYRSAADRFLKAFTNFPSSEKAPEALLKLAISLRRLGENSAACDSFAELEKRFPQAPKQVLQRAETEKKRANCA
jgi:tol-pal system protein YbgF